MRDLDMNVFLLARLTADLVFVVRIDSKAEVKNFKDNFTYRKLRAR